MNLVEILKGAVKWDVAGWFAAFGRIRIKAGSVEQVEPNEYQRKISEIVLYCHEHGIPCRIVALKPRQKGSTTFSVAVAYRRLMAKMARGLLAGGAHFQGSNMFKMLETYVNHDDADRGKVRVKTMEAVYANGSTLERITLRNAQAGRSGTYQVLVITEVAYLSDEGVANADDVVAGLIKCVPDEPDTIIIEESTANGATGYFYKRYDGAVTFEEFKAGKPGAIKVFSAWFEFADSRRDPVLEQIENEGDLTSDEVDLMREWKLDLWQVAWMRWAIREECGGDFEKFQEDYPFDDESAFLKSGRGKFGQAGLKRGADKAKVAGWKYGNFVKSPSGRVGFVPCDYPQSMWAMLEEPRDGRRYLLSVDGASGDSETSGEDPDSHGVGVHRAGYVSADGWVEPSLVLRNALHDDGTGKLHCWWDTDILIDQVELAAEYYGRCLVVPEMNHDRGLVETLKVRGVNLYQRTEINRRTNEPTKYYGWKTEASNRGMIIDAFAAMIRDSGTMEVGKGYDMRCPWTVSEMRNFVIKASGRAEAASGEHDDQVLMCCIGAFLVNDLATPYYAEMFSRRDPDDVRRILAAGVHESVGGGTYGF